MNSGLRPEGFRPGVRPAGFRAASLVGRPGLWDVRLADGRIASIVPCAQGAPGGVEARGKTGDFGQLDAEGMADLAGRLLLPGFVDLHTHLDKALTWGDTGNPEGTLRGAIASFEAYASRLTEEDVQDRAMRVMEAALLAGTTTVRTHVQFGSQGTLFDRSLSGLLEAKRRMQGRMTLQTVLMCPTQESGAVERVLSSGAADHLEALGGAPHLSEDPSANMEWIAQLAERYGLGLDVHMDEQMNPASRTLVQLADIAARRRWPLPVVAGHCVSLAAMPEEEADAIAQRVAEAGVGVAALPACNLFLQGRNAFPVPRGVTRARLLYRRGVEVAVASDNVQDAFHPYGRADLLEAALLMAYADHFDPAEAGVLLAMISEAPGRLATGEAYGIEQGLAADLVAVDACRAHEALVMQPVARDVYKSGELVARTRRTSYTGSGVTVGDR